MLGGCSTGDEAGLAPERYYGPTGSEVAFSTDMDLFTRATTGTIDNLDALKATGEGFGVFAYLTGTSNWTTAKGSYAVGDADYPTPDFMMNQQVTWGVQYAPEGGAAVRDWVYSPLKYWPNGTTGTADPLVNDGNTDATNPRHVSFFAYAPRVDSRLTDAPATATLPATAAGVISYTRSADKSPHVWYVVGDGGAGQTDLLWASCTDARRNEQGLIEVDKAQQAHTYQRVPLSFKHALACVDVYVQRVYGEQAFGGKRIIDGMEVDSTKLFVCQLKLTAASGFIAPGSRGRLDLETGTWSGQTHPGGDVARVLTLRESLFEDSLRGTVKSGVSIAAELDRWPLRGYGVDERERRLFRADSVLTMIPQTLTLMPEVTYSMVTQDDALLLSDALQDSEGHLYSRIVNTLVANPVTVTFEAGKRYTLLLRIGVEHVAFEVLSVVDWDFPLRYEPEVVTGFAEETQNKRIDEQ